MLVNLLGLMAAVVSTAAGLPELYKIIKSKNTRDVSLAYLLLLFAGSSLWLTYGSLITSLPLILSCIATFCIWSPILVFKLKYK